MLKKLLIEKKNVVITAVIAVLMIVCGLMTTVDFVHFRNYRAEFVVREEVIDEIQTLSQYSPSLEGTLADVEIYITEGDENTVALAKAEKITELGLDTIDGIKDAKRNGKVSIWADSAQIAIADAQAMQLESSYYTSVSKAEAIAKVKEADQSSVAQVAIVSRAVAEAAVKADETLAIAEAVVEKTPSILIIGGTHPNEPSPQLTATILLENITVQRGTVYLITELNRSAYSYSQPQEGAVWYYTIPTQNGERVFKYGSRLSNTIDQYPVPDVYTHSSGQQLSSNEVRNLNRAYPGSVNGTFTERIAYGVTNLINTNDITIEIDLHEASPEYLTNDAGVYHQDTAKVMSQARIVGFKYQDPETSKNKKMKIKLDVSPTNMHGLTHRELGDFTNAYCFLFETSCAAIGRIHGAFTEELVTYYDHNDKFYEYLIDLDKELEERRANGEEGVRDNYLYANPVSINERVARHTLSVESVIMGYNKIKTARTEYTESKLPEEQRHTGDQYLGELKVNNIPSYTGIYTNGVGHYLLESER